MSDSGVLARELADEQAALRRVATLVAGGAPANALFSAVAEEVANVVGVPSVTVDRYDANAMSTVLASLGDNGFPVGSRWPVEAPSISATVFETGQPARIDDYSDLSGAIAAAVRESPISSGVGAPIVVDGKVWGVITLGTREPQPLPSGVEARLAAFSELVATAISNTAVRHDLRRLADEQAALRRVATLVAEGATADELFSVVTREVAIVLGVPSVTLDRYEAGSSVVIGSVNDPGFPVGSRWSLDTPSLGKTIFETGRPARIDDYSDVPGAIGAAARATAVTSAVGVPIIVDGHIWGVMCAGTTGEGEPMPADTAARLAGFTELLATAISNAQARAELIASRARIVAAGDEARRKIERNLHDGLQQRLIALGLDLQTVRRGISTDAEADAGLDRIEHEIEAVLDDVRELSRGLHPALLSRAGLGPSLRALARRSPIHVTLELDLDQRPPDSVEIGVYYAVSEALTNAAKHSDASEICVTVKSDGVMLLATIEDDGVGGAQANAGSGLVGLVDRVETLGGRLALESPPGVGTTISIELPV